MVETLPVSFQHKESVIRDMAIASCGMPMMRLRLFLTHFRYISIQVRAAAIFSCQFVVEAAAKVADVAFGTYKEDGHLEGAALDDEEADDMALLFGHGLVGLVHGILLLESC